MKAKKLLAMTVGMVMCGAMFAGCGDTGSGSTGGDAKPADTTAAADKPADGGDAKPADGSKIKVGIINNDPNESGYRTANDKDLKEAFSEANGYDADFFYSLKNDEQIAAAQKYIQDEVDYLLLSAADTAG